MALGECVECGGKVSSEAPACPHCGKPKPLVPQVPSTETEPRLSDSLSTQAFSTGTDEPRPSDAPEALQVSAVREKRAWMSGKGCGLLVLFGLAGLFIGSVVSDSMVLSVLYAVGILCIGAGGVWLAVRKHALMGILATLIAALLLLINANAILKNLDKIRDQQVARRASEAEAEQQKKDADYFNSNSSRILEELRKSLESGDYNEVLTRSSRYLSSQNEELVELNSKAKAVVATGEILDRLRRIPEYPSNFEKKKLLYEQLVEYNPDNPEFKKQVSSYSAKIKNRGATERVEREKLRVGKEREQSERRSRIAQFGEPPSPSSWDGSYRPVKEYLKRVANDPESIEIDACTEVYSSKDGWIVGCDYRGRNAFGGMVRQSNWFVIVRDRVVEMREASAYKP